MSIAFTQQLVKDVIRRQGLELTKSELANGKGSNTIRRQGFLDSANGKTNPYPSGIKREEWFVGSTAYDEFIEDIDGQQHTTTDNRQPGSPPGLPDKE